MTLEKLWNTFCERVEGLFGANTPEFLNDFNTDQELRDKVMVTYYEHEEQKTARRTMTEEEENRLHVELSRLSMTLNEGHHDE